MDNKQLNQISEQESEKVGGGNKGDIAPCKRVCNCIPGHCQHKHDSLKPHGRKFRRRGSWKPHHHCKPCEPDKKGGPIGCLPPVSENK